MPVTLYRNMLALARRCWGLLLQCFFLTWLHRCCEHDAMLKDENMDAIKQQLAALRFMLKAT